MWLEVTLIGPVGTVGSLAPEQSVTTDWPGAAPLTWIVEPGGRIALNLRQNELHPDPTVRRASVMNLWVRPTGRSSMARVVQGMAAVGVPELGELRGAALTAFYRAVLDRAQRGGSGRIGCLVALDGDVSAGDERAFEQDLICAAREPPTGCVLAEAAATLGVGVDEQIVSSRLDADALRARMSPDPAVGWFLWDLQLDGREPGGRVRVSRTGLTVEG